MKQQLHRSIIFWSGLLVIGFIVWAWGRSIHRESVFIFYPRGFATGITSAAAGIIVIHEPNASAPPTASWADRPLKPGEYGGRLFPRLVHQRGVRDTPDYPEMPQLAPNPTIEQFLNYDIPTRKRGTRALFIPHWLILLTVAALWLALLFWRARRPKRTITP